MLDGLAEDLSHRSEQAQPFVLRQGLDRSLRVDACLPERLVGDDVADAGDESLIHQRRLGSPAPSAKPLQELPLRESQGVGAEASQDGVRLGRGWGEPRPSQLAHVAIAELTVVGHQDEPIPAVAIRLVSRPHQIASHPEVEQQRGTVGRACQPLAVPVRLIESAAPKRLLQGIWAGVAHDRRIGLDSANDLAGAVLKEEPAEMLDVGKFRHATECAGGRPPSVTGPREAPRAPIGRAP